MRNSTIFYIFARIVHRIKKTMKSKISTSLFTTLLFISLLFSSCKTKKEYITRTLQPEIRTVVVEKESKNSVSDEDMAILGMLHRGCRNFSTAPSFPSSTWEGRLQSRLLELCNQSLFESSQLAIVVYDITDNRCLFSVNATQRLRPASCQKLVTAVCALDILGASHSYVPRIDKAGEGWCWDDDITRQMPYKEKRRWTMEEVLNPMMKESDNRLAESLFWQLSTASSGSSKQDISAVIPQMEKVMEKAGIPQGSGYRIADGSGLSLYNYTTAEILNSLLVYAWNQQDIRSMLIPSLPVGGVDGTLKNRFTGTKACSNIFAKTGSVTGVSSLCGYANGGNGHVLSFCIINQGVERASLGRSFQDQVCVALTE